MTLDAVARLLLEEAGPLSGRILVVEDAGGALTRAALDAGADVRAWCDDLRDEEAVPEGVRTPTPTPPDGWRPDLVLWRLPKALSALEDTAERLSGALTAEGRLLAGGRIRHMTRAQNDVLARSFGTVTASLGRQKSRVLRASEPQRPEPTWPRRRHLGEIGLTVVAHGATFATNRLDDGTGLLLRALGREASDGGGRRALDLGSGSGIIAAWLAQRGWAVEATDVSTDAVASTLLTAAANGVAVSASRVDALASVPPGCDLIASNPPFHRGTEKDSGPTLAMIRDARRVLAPAGELWLVFNSHLPYLPELRRHVGATDVVVQDRHYLVTRSRAT